MENNNKQIASIVITVTVIKGVNLVAKDKNWVTMKNTSSDPYVKLYYRDKYVGKTKVIYKNLSPTWNQEFTINTSTDEAIRALQGQPNFKNLHLLLFDKDRLSEDDFMGESIVVLPLSGDFSKPRTSWYPVGNGTGKLKCRNPSGKVEVKVAVVVNRIQNMVRGNTYPLPCIHIKVSLQWEIEAEQKTDLDTSCVAIDRNGDILMDETVYFGDLVNSNGSIQHSGDARQGGIGEIINCDLDKVSDNVLALYFIVTVATPDRTLNDVQTALVSVMSLTSDTSLCQFTPGLGEGEGNTAMFLMRVTREKQNWTMTIIEDMDCTARDFGTLIPNIKGYSRDLCPGIVIDSTERIAMMRKGRSIQLKDYNGADKTLVFALAWDITKGNEIDLDASAICLDSSLNEVEIISYERLESENGSIRHLGDEKEGDEEGDDEEIVIQLQDIDPIVMYLGFVITSFSGQELDDVSKAKCRLYNQSSQKDLATYQISNDKSLDKHTGLLMACLYRDADDWNLRVIGKAAHGKNASDLVKDLQDLLANEPAPQPAFVPGSETIVSAMPDSHPLSKNRVVIANPYVSENYV